MGSKNMIYVAEKCSAFNWIFMKFFFLHRFGVFFPECTKIYRFSCVCVFFFPRYYKANKIIYIFPCFSSDAHARHKHSCVVWLIVCNTR